VASHDACLVGEIFQVASLKDLSEQASITPFQYICLLPIHTSGGAVCDCKGSEKKLNHLHFRYLRQIIYENLTPKSPKWHIFEHLSKEKRKAYRH
jgi:hypothetical protein